MAWFFKQYKKHTNTQQLLDIEAIQNVLHGLDLDFSNETLQTVNHPRAGIEPSSQRGQGVDLVENREYQIGDNPKHINWRMSARLTKIHTKIFQEEKHSQTLVVVDCRPSMWFGTKVQLKMRQALLVAALFMASAAKRAQAYAMLTVTDALCSVPFYQSQSQLFDLLLNASRVSNRPSRDVEPIQLNFLLEFIHRHYPMGNHVVIVSDFYDFNRQDQNRIEELSQHNRITLVNISDPADWSLPVAGQIHCVGKEPWHIMSIDSANKAVRDEFNHQLQQQQKYQESLLHACHVPVVDLDVRDQSYQSLRAFL